MLSSVPSSSTPFKRMPTAFEALPSPEPRFFVEFQLETLVEVIEPAEEVDHGHQFENPFIVQAEFPHRGSVNGNSVVASQHR